MPTLSASAAEDLHAAYAHRAEAKVRAQARFVIVNIGANVLFDFELEAYRSSLARWPHRLVFVEPNPAAVRRLRRHSESFRRAFPRSRIQVIEAALCEGSDDEEPEIFLYRDVNDPLDPLASLDLQRMFAMGKSSVEEVPIRCLTAAEVLKEADLSAEMIDGLKVDAEGCDAQALRAFLGLRGFGPAALRFEYVHADRTALSALSTELAHRGYDVHIDDADVVAVAAPRLAGEAPGGRSSVAGKILPRPVN